MKRHALYSKEPFHEEWVFEGYYNKDANLAIKVDSLIMEGYSIRVYKHAPETVIVHNSCKLISNLWKHLSSYVGLTKV